MTSCWHCVDSRCVCLTCDGPCASCKGIAYMRELGPLLDKYGVDIRDLASWVLVRPETGHNYRVLKLAQQLGERRAA